MPGPRLLRLLLLLLRLLEGHFEPSHRPSPAAELVEPNLLIAR